jgi:hypothetical protein
MPTLLLLHPSAKELERGEGKYSKSCTALLAGEYSITFLMIVTLSIPVLLCPSKIFKETKKSFPYYGIFNSVL